MIAAGILLTAGVVAWHLRRIDYFWQNPLRSARFTRLTDWDGSEVDAAISSDGKLVTFLSDRDGPFDAWVTQVGSDEFLNLSKRLFPDLYLDRVRNVGFSGDDAHAWMRIDVQGGTGGLLENAWLVPNMGGNARPFLVGMEARMTIQPRFAARIKQHLVGYAADRFVTIVPEIDTPGHTAALLRLRPLSPSLSASRMLWPASGLALLAHCWSIQEHNHHPSGLDPTRFGRPHPPQLDQQCTHLWFEALGPSQSPPLVASP